MFNNVYMDPGVVVAVLGSAEGKQSGSLFFSSELLSTMLLFCDAASLARFQWVSRQCKSDVIDAFKVAVAVWGFPEEILVAGKSAGLTAELRLLRFTELVLLKQRLWSSHAGGLLQLLRNANAAVHAAGSAAIVGNDWCYSGVRHLISFHGSVQSPDAPGAPVGECVEYMLHSHEVVLAALFNAVHGRVLPKLHPGMHVQGGDAIEVVAEVCLIWRDLGAVFSPGRGGGVHGTSVIKGLLFVADQGNVAARLVALNSLADLVVWAGPNLRPHRVLMEEGVIEVMLKVIKISVGVDSVEARYCTGRATQILFALSSSHPAAIKTWVQTAMVKQGGISVFAAARAKRGHGWGGGAFFSAQLLETCMHGGGQVLQGYDITAFYKEGVIEAMACVARHGCQVSRRSASSVLVSIACCSPGTKEDPRDEHVFRNEIGIHACLYLAGQPFDLKDANDNQKMTSDGCRFGALMILSKLTSMSDLCGKAVVAGGGVGVCAKLARIKGMAFRSRMCAALILIHLCHNDAHAWWVDAGDGIGAVVEVATDDQDAECRTARSMLRLLPWKRFERVLLALGGRVLSVVIAHPNTTLRARNTARSALNAWNAKN